MRDATAKFVAWALCLGATSVATATDWKLASGESVRGELTGVINGQAVIKTVSRREYLPLSRFAIESRDELCAALRVKRLDDRIPELMAFENARYPRVEAPRGTDDPKSPDYGPLLASRDVGEARPETYQLPIPSRPLLADATSRDWTDLTGGKSSASFVQTVPPLHVQLRLADGSVRAFGLANFAADDHRAIRQALDADWAKPVFPESGGGAVGQGTRWTDRLGRTLNAEFDRLEGRDVVFKVGPDERRYPIAGLSDGDVSRIRFELERRAAPPPPPVASGVPGSRFDSGIDAVMARMAEDRERRRVEHEARMDRFRQESLARQNEMQDRLAKATAPRTYEFHCDRCGHGWTADTSIAACPECLRRLSDHGHSGGDVMEWSCTGCRFKWNGPRDDKTSRCPQCGAKFWNAPSSGGSGKSSGLGVLIVFGVAGVGGLAVVGGIGLVVYKASRASAAAPKRSPRRRPRDTIDDD